MLSLKDFKSFEVNNKSFVGGGSGLTNDGVHDEDFISDAGEFWVADGGIHTRIGCLCVGGSTGNGSDSYSMSCCVK